MLRGLLLLYLKSVGLEPFLPSRLNQELDTLNACIHMQPVQEIHVPLQEELHISIPHPSSEEHDYLARYKKERSFL